MKTTPITNYELPSRAFHRWSLLNILL
jgi:hypothetical protein